MRYAKTFLSAVLAGICIAIGGTAFLSVTDKALGAVLFTVGLFIICSHGLDLFTGRVCYILQGTQRYVLDVVVIWLGNLTGTWITASAEKLTRLGDDLTGKAADLCQAKLEDGLLSIFILAILCNILIYIAVEGYRSQGKHLALFFGVVVFILCGFEHCVANMYYFTMAGAWSGRTALCLAVTTLGNTVGGVIMPTCRGWLENNKGRRKT